MTNPKAKLTALSAGLFLLLAGDAARAGANLRDAAYTLEWTDLELRPGDLRFSRSYSSRSRFNGILGFGWCTAFEVSIERIDTERLLLRECAGGDLVFKANGAGIHLSPQRPGEWIETRRGQLTRGLPSGERQIFANSGRLRTWHRPGSPPIEIGYGPTGLLEEIRSGRAKLTLTYEARTRKISRVHGSGGDSNGGPGGRSVTYRRAGEDLIKIRGPGGETHEYGYDELHNLTRAKFPDGAVETNVYEKDLDRLVSTTDRDSCATRISYSALEPETGSGQKTRTDTHCPGRPAKTRTIEFWWARDADGATYLSRSRDAADGLATETWFDAEHGQPVRLSNADGRTFHLFYDGSGRLSAVFEAGREALRLIYKDDSRKPAEVRRPGSGAIRLEYDGRGRVRAAHGARAGEIAGTLKDIFGGWI